jgi:hypothetical protein
MKSGSVILSLYAVIVVATTGCITTVVRPADVLVSSEDAAITKLGDDIYSFRVIMNNKRIGIFYFTTLDWRIVDAGKRISGRLGDYLARKGGLRMIPRAELDAIMKTQAIEQASIFDVEAIQKRGKALPVDAIIIGTVAQADGTVEIGLKVVDVATGRLMLLTGVRMPAAGEIISQANPEIVQLNKKSPEKITAMNKTYFLLQWMKSNQPLVFLLAVVEDREMKILRTTNTVLAGKLARRKERYRQERPDVIKKIRNLQDGLSLMERYESQRFSEIINWKKELLARMK